VRRRFATASLLIAWLCANGAIWDVMQVAAWGKMFAGYSGTMTISQALQQTFDPAKPCEMCVGIAKAKDATDKKLPSNEQTAGAKFILVMHAAEAPVFTNDPGDWVNLSVGRLTERTDPVPLPPPRV
jgi:hypothetical protein